jgi:PIN domain nuclease of toxin-antitoxin system
LSSVLDASAVFAVLNDELGAEIVAAELEPIISAVNLSEVIARLSDRGVTQTDIDEMLAELRLDVRTFDAELAFAAGFLRPSTRARGLSFGDRACLALAMALELPALTADRSWRGLALGVDVRVIR